MAIVSTHQIQIDFDNSDDDIEIEENEFTAFEEEVARICSSFNYVDSHVLFKGDINYTPNIYIDCRTLEDAEAIEKKVVAAIADKGWRTSEA